MVVGIEIEGGRTSSIGEKGFLVGGPVGGVDRVVKGFDACTPVGGLEVDGGARAKEVDIVWQSTVAGQGIAGDGRQAIGIHRPENLLLRLNILFRGGVYRPAGAEVVDTLGVEVDRESIGGIGWEGEVESGIVIWRGGGAQVDGEIAVPIESGRSGVAVGAWRLLGPLGLAGQPEREQGQE